ncbi:MAG TPA: RNA-guided endonuclease TnpB family protein [Ktedonobacterales bacterium]|nr:RNA-guided endonuclease TnpB family protein [Ktedonobacterales bacterium]
MKQTLLVKLAPTSEQHAALLRTLEAFNAACNAIAAVAFQERMASKIDLQKLVYYDIRRDFGLAAQMAIRAIAKVSEAYKRDRSKQPHFRPHGAMVYDERILSFPRIDRASLLTLDGRVEVPFRFGAYAEGMLARKRGQADLLYRNNTFFLAITVDAPEPTPADTVDCVGVDLGIIQLATTSDGEFLNYSAAPKHSHINQVRARYSRFRQKLQKTGTKSAKRLLRKRSGREKRFAKDVNHCLSKAIVQTAQGTSRGIALEDLQGIRERAKRTVGKRQRRVLHTWSFFQLRAFIAYKAALAGVRVVYVNPAYTSQTCSACGQCEKANRHSQSKFLCRSCGFSAHADVNAAVNIRARSRAAVNRPDAAAIAG